MKKELEALEKMAISHEITSDYINPYLEFKNPNKRIEINPLWEEEINIVKQALTKLSTIELLVDKKKFNTNDIELLRASIIEVLERDDDE